MKDYTQPVFAPAPWPTAMSELLPHAAMLLRQYASFMESDNRPLTANEARGLADALASAAQHAVAPQSEAEDTLVEYAMQIAHERELHVLGHKHDSEGALQRFRSAVARLASAPKAASEDWGVLDSLGWQRAVCPACGSDMARAAPKAAPAPAAVAGNAPTPDVQAKIDSNTWDSLSDVLPVLKSASRGKWGWPANPRCKYIELRIDMRDGGCLIRDREGVRISPEQLAHQSHPGGLPWSSSEVDGVRPAAQGDALDDLIEHYGRVVFQRCRIGHVKGKNRWDIEMGYCDLTVSGATLPAAIDAARAAKEGGKT